MQPADSARYTADILVAGELYGVYLDVTDSWKELACSLTVGSRIFHKQPVAFARYTSYIFVYGNIDAVHLDIAGNWKYTQISDRSHTDIT